VQTLRNQVTHSQWGVGNSPATVTRIETTARRRGGLDHKFVQMTAAEIDAIATAARDVALAFHTFSSKLPAELVGRVEIEIGSEGVAYRYPGPSGRTGGSTP
jgi:hypothetical protein